MRSACLNDQVFFCKIVKFACIKKRICNLHQVFASELAFMDASDEEQEEDEEMLLACVLAGEYLEEKKKVPNIMLERESSGNNTLQSKLLKEIVQDGLQLILETMLYYKSSSSS